MPDVEEKKTTSARKTKKATEVIQEPVIEATEVVKAPKKTAVKRAPAKKTVAKKEETKEENVSIPTDFSAEVTPANKTYYVVTDLEYESYPGYIQHFAVDVQTPGKMKMSNILELRSIILSREDVMYKGEKPSGCTVTFFTEIAE